MFLLCVRVHCLSALSPFASLSLACVHFRSQTALLRLSTLSFATFSMYSLALTSARTPLCFAYRRSALLRSACTCLLLLTYARIHYHLHPSGTSAPSKPHRIDLSLRSLAWIPFALCTRTITLMLSLICVFAPSCAHTLVFSHSCVLHLHAFTRLCSHAPVCLYISAFTHLRDTLAFSHFTRLHSCVFTLSCLHFCFRAFMFLTLEMAFRSSPRPISIGKLHVLPHFHRRPIYLIVSEGSYQLVVVAVLFFRGASRLDAFSVYPVRTSLPCYALGRTTVSPEVRPSRSSRTRDSSRHDSNAHNG